jgi:hypothetical protein
MTPVNAIEIADAEDATTRQIVVAKRIAKHFHPRASAHHW